MSTHFREERDKILFFCVFCAICVDMWSSVCAAESWTFDTYCITLCCVSMVKLCLSSDVFNICVRGFPDTFSITPRFIAHFIHNIFDYNTHNSYTMTVLKKYHKVGLGRNHGDKAPPSIPQTLSQKRIIWIPFMFEFHLWQWLLGSLKSLNL